MRGTVGHSIRMSLCIVYEILAEIRGNGRQLRAGDIGILQDLSQQAADQENFSLLNRIIKLMREMLPGQGSLNLFDFDDNDADDDLDDDDLDDDAIGSDAPLAAILDAIGANRKKLLAMAKTSGIEATLRSYYESTDASRRPNTAAAAKIHPERSVAQHAHNGVARRMTPC